MSKVIKLKQSDIEKLVENIVSEIGYDDFDSKIQPEELPGANEPSMEDIMNSDEGDELTLAQNPKTGEFFVLKNATTENPEIVARTK